MISAGELLIIEYSRAKMQKEKLIFWDLLGQLLTIAQQNAKYIFWDWLGSGCLPQVHTCQTCLPLRSSSPPKHHRIWWWFSRSSSSLSAPPHHLHHQKPNFGRQRFALGVTATLSPPSFAEELWSRQSMRNVKLGNMKKVTALLTADCAKGKYTPLCLAKTYEIIDWLSIVIWNLYDQHDIDHHRHRHHHNNHDQDQVSRRFVRMDVFSGPPFRRFVRKTFCQDHLRRFVRTDLL